MPWEKKWKKSEYRRTVLNRGRLDESPGSVQAQRPGSV